MKRLIVQLGDVQGTEVNVDNNDTAPLLQKEIDNTSNKETERQAEATNKANGNQKLLDLGLTQAEATALTGYTPPVAE